MPYGLKGLGDCINVQNGVGVDSTSGAQCVIGNPVMVDVLPSGGATYTTGGVTTAGSPQTFQQWLNQNGLYVGLGLAAFFGLMAAVKR